MLYKKENKKRETKREKEGKICRKIAKKKTKKKKRVHAHTSWWRDPCAVTSDVMVKISVVYSKANYIPYRLNVPLNMYLGGIKIYDKIFNPTPFSIDFLETFGRRKDIALKLMQ